MLLSSRVNTAYFYTRMRIGTIQRVVTCQSCHGCETVQLQELPRRDRCSYFKESVLKLNLKDSAVWDSINNSF